MKRKTFTRTLVATLAMLLAFSPGLSGVGMASELPPEPLVVEDVVQETSDLPALREADDPEYDGSDASADQSPIEVVAQSDSSAQEGEDPQMVLVEQEDPQDPRNGQELDVKAESASDKPVLNASGFAKAQGGIEASKTSSGVMIGSKAGGTSLTGIQLKLSRGTVAYKAYMQNAGWQAQKTSGQVAGNKGTGKLLGAVKITLSDDVAQSWSVRYRCYVRSIGWMGWAADGAVAGVTDKSERSVSAIEVRIVPKDSKSARGGGKAWIDAGLVASAHVQGSGWKDPKSGHNIKIGSTGKGLRLEALKLSVSDGIDASGSIMYNAHVQGIGWQGNRSNGAVAGTTGSGRRVEAITIKLTGELGRTYDIWYRLHVAGAGWLGWTCNGSKAGTEGLSMRVEALQIALVQKGSGMPSQKGQNVATPFVSGDSIRYAAASKGTWTSWKNDGKSLGAANGAPIQGLRMTTSSDLSGSIKYSVHVAKLGWQKYVSNGDVAASGNKAVQAIRVKLSGELARVYNVWYRCYVEGYGWTGWASNGANSGSVGLGKPVTKIKVVLRSRAQGAPGSTATPCFLPFTSGDKELDKILDNIVKNVTGTGSDALRKGYDYVSSFPYRSGSKWPAGSWRTWSVGFAKEMYNNHSGNCYRYASLMCWIARRLGYDASVVSGEVLAHASGRSAHGWCEVKIDGQVYILDPDLQWEIPSRSFYLKTYDNAPVYYYK